MLQLSYISTARKALSPEELETVLQASRRNNAKAGVTGLLVVGGRRFLQVLEGPEAEVTATYERIKADPRHFALVQLSRRVVEGRGFGDWAMGYRAGGEGLKADVEALIRDVADKDLHALFAGFAEIHAKAA